jgi:predicted PurR-regulated permease PerM
MRRWRRGITLCVTLLLFLWLAYIAREVWLPLCIAFLIAMVLDPLVDRMERRGWSRLRGATVIYLAFFVTGSVILTFAVPAIITQTTAVVNSIGQYLPGETDTQTKRSLEKLLHKAHASPFVEHTVLNASTQISRSFNSAGAWLGSMAQGVAANLIWIVIIPIVAFYALKDFHVIFARLLLLLPREQRSLAEQLINQTSAIFVRYLRGLMIVCALNAVVTAVVLACLRLPNAIALGAISGALYTVPYLGAALTVTLIAGVALMSGTIKSALIITGIILVLHNVVFDQILTPRIVGQHVGLHPILSIIALLVGAALLGIVGMILAVPVAATVQMILVNMFPKLTQPIEVPAGHEFNAKVEEMVEQQQQQNTSDEMQDMVDFHQTIIEAVELAEENTAAAASDSDGATLHAS